MSKAKKLELTIPMLIEIAKAINKNTITNRTRSRSEKINTDTFIKKFGINRKDFSETIKGTSIKYNRNIFQYAFEDIEDINKKSELMIAATKYNDSETLVVKSETVETNMAIIEFENMKSGLVEMLEWYKDQRLKENIIEIEMPLISIDKEKLTEQAMTRGFKIYPGIVAQFKEFCKENSQFTMQDLMAMALIEYMDKYKK